MEVLSRIQKIHDACFKLCFEALGRHLPVAGNVAIFCQSEEEFDTFSKLKEELTYPSENPNQKYFALKKPIRISNLDAGTAAIYTHLYIRNPNSASPEAGDIDFILSEKEYGALKQRLLNGELIKGASIYDRPGWDTIEIRDPEIDALAYVSTREMAVKVRVRFD